MARPTSRHPTELELEILKVLWRHGALPVRAVREKLQPKRTLAFNSVMTVMNIMVDKGYLTRAKDGVHVYSTAISQHDVQHSMLRDIVERVFGGSPSAVMSSLLEASDLDKQDIEDLRQLLKRQK